MGAGNNAMKILRMLYRPLCLDFEGLHNPVDQWSAAGRRAPIARDGGTTQLSAEVLPGWHQGFETAVRNPIARDAFRFGLFPTCAA